MGHCYIGCAGWALPKSAQDSFAVDGSHLERYASRLSAVEINSSFYKPHKPVTYARWAGSVPSGFRFSVKVPKAITHERRLVGCEDLLDAFLLEAGQLGDKLGCLLVQLPPSLTLDEARADAFFAALAQRHAGPVVIEPRHASWFGDQGRALLGQHAIELVKADPAPCAGAAWDLVPSSMPPTEARPGVAYYRLHGAPRIYYSSYDDAYLQALARRLREEGKQRQAVWCIFDNTAEGAAIANALAIMGLV